MKKREFGKRAFLGLASGLIAFGSGSAQADEASFDAQHMLTHKGCKGGGGCGGLTASRDKTSEDADENDDDELSDNSSSSSTSGSSTKSSSEDASQKKNSGTKNSPTVPSYQPHQN
jgi:hypothetical protein